MVLEATMICIDNSEWMRNGDYSPSRFQAQADAVNLVCGIKTGANPENTVGVLTMAGKGVRVLATPTSDLGKILTCTHGLEIGGEINIAAAVQVAQLALKHRQNKNQQQRIVVFAGSPVKDDKKALEIIGKKLKKNSVALDIVDFGGEDEKSEKLEALVAAVDNRNTSHVVHVPSGPDALSDVLLSTPILIEQGEAGAAAEGAAAGIGGSSGFEFGVNPNIDPELALALRMSMEEERARQEAAEARRAEEEAAKQGKEEEQPSKSEDVAMTESGDVEMVDENALLMQALSMSMADAEMSEATGVDQDLALALQMSMKEGAGGVSSSSSEAADVTKVMDDQSFLSSILESLPGVDPNDPSVKEFLASLSKQSDKDEQDRSNDQGK
ncbi:26S proteasome non-ATPase regulatory subunit 4 homolog [Argentina anserina]|uniref:26S proteasome non-ATPase regulatory subunit 4 homolog n=1 Tax=Argentina anserina TaxID=57926 RepID=UPI0021766A32|nr:26S proteasome non-ATPase regulatory subunit 4 homolog [Potentilla anserina]